MSLWPLVSKSRTTSKTHRYQIDQSPRDYRADMLVSSCRIGQITTALYLGRRSSDKTVTSGG